jgi:hypothetical protein
MAARLAAAVYFSLAPATLPEWRLAPTLPPARVLPIGEPTPRLVARHSLRLRS